MKIKKTTVKQIDCEYLTVTDVAEKCNVARSTVWRWVKNGILKPVSEIMGRKRFLESDVEKVLKGSKL